MSFAKDPPSPELGDRLHDRQQVTSSQTNDRQNFATNREMHTRQIVHFSADSESQTRRTRICARNSSALHRLCGRYGGTLPPSSGE